MWSWTVRVTIQFPSASSAVVDETHRCIATFWVQILTLLLFLFYNTIPLFELIDFVMFMRSTALILFELRSCSSHPLHIDVQEWHCHLLTVHYSCDISLLILTWRSKLMCKRCRMWQRTQVQINSSVLATLEVWLLLLPLQLSPDTFRLIHYSLWIQFWSQLWFCFPLSHIRWIFILSP